MRSQERVGFSLILVCFTLLASGPATGQTPLPPAEEDFFESPLLQMQSFETPESTNEELENLPPPLVRSIKTGGGGPGMGGISGSPMGGMGSPAGGGRPVYAYSFFQPASGLGNQPGSLEARGEGFAVGVPISRSSNGIWILSTRLEHDTFRTNATLPGTTMPFPDELWNINLSLMHIHSFDNGWTFGGMVGAGSSSDRPFASIREVNANLLTFLNIPASERDAWNFSLFYSPLGQLRFPIPGVAYAWRPSDQFQMNIGIPFSLTYRPTETVSFNMSYLPLTNANATLRWTPNESWTLYGGYMTHSQGYELADRVDTRQRFFNFDQRLATGIQRSLGKGFYLDLSAAYLFDRSYFLGDSFFGSGAERLRVDPGAQVMLRLEWAR
ncbi:DUF6268 family outer membrane beta-barrel protein [Schlesneria sp.]|uniref:DUF6268 family outer membrane beta-barrel protein n=1 Tax=Schlesneria sp. TaxID=2762018 RepID=UPI002F22BE9D